MAAQTPALYEEAQAELAANDTASALVTLRRLTEAEPDFAPGWGLLGSTLTAIASDVATDFKQRREAEEALRRALELDPHDPAYLAAFGRLKRKQQIYLDARRLLDRAIDEIEKDPGRLDAPERAELWFQRGLFIEDAYLDGLHYHALPNPPPVQTPDCSGIGTFCMNFTRPSQFNEYFLPAFDLSEEVEDEYEDMAEAFERALAADPTHSGAFRRQAIHLVDRGDLREAERLARDFVEAAPEEPWGYLILGLVYFRSSRDSLAEVEFDRGIERASPRVASHYLDVSSLLQEALAEAYTKAPADQRRQLEGVLWRKSDPLYLTPGNEVRVAHLARVTYADIMFEDPTHGTWGAETEQGIIYVRYGPPERIFKIRRDPTLEASSVSQPNVRGGGRWIFWNYGMDVPNFIFQKQQRYRHASHVFSSGSKQQEELTRANQPAVFRTHFDLMDYPAQIARFRGASDSVVEVDLYSEVPAGPALEGAGAAAAGAAAAAVAADSIDVGLFLHAGTRHLEVVDQKLRVAAKESSQPLTYSLALPGGSYEFSLEARATEQKAAVKRSTLEVNPYPSDSLALSDLVVALSVAPRTAAPTDRRGFAIRVNRRLEFEPDDPFFLYWEVYGLEVDKEGVSSYRVTVTVSDAEGKGVLASLLGAVAGLVGGGDDDDVELVFERTVEVRGDRVPDYLELRLSEDEPGSYRVRIEVTDLVGKETASSERTFQLIGPQG